MSVFSTKTFLPFWAFFSLRNFWYGAAALRVASTANLFTGPCLRSWSLLRTDGMRKWTIHRKYNSRIARLQKRITGFCYLLQYKANQGQSMNRIFLLETTLTKCSFGYASCLFLKMKNNSNFYIKYYNFFIRSMSLPSILKNHF